MEESVVRKGSLAPPGLGQLLREIRRRNGEITSYVRNYTQNGEITSYLREGSEKRHDSLIKSAQSGDC